ncbi:galactose-3-O-sulfotransferase 4 [Tyto alba]|uniref:galactose-3-O-sulfotransferase 4 n=1 Tax=Tyto alba TaxID=56313 RepID=UPI001C67E36E|nr:galactose-3-O-sulfotransferase 4 [Tyto alba]XP_042654207.1 galactose-3-O-sulfotransferase 4 [Tyto alba]
MKLPPACCRLQTLGAALGVCVTIGFTLQLLGGPLQRRAPAAHPGHPPAPCQPRTHLVFLKTHKTGGSSVVNLLHRFGEAQGLRFALPHRYQFGYPSPFRAERVKGYQPGGPPFDIICHHMRFNLTEVQKVMPNDSFYFSIVRDPGTLGESAFAYYRAVAPAFRRAPSLAAFLAAPGRFYEAGARGNHYARNLQWFDFGLPAVGEEDRAGVTAALEGLERVFPLVLLAEHFDESLVLLREALCWPEEAVAAFAHNGRPAGDAPRVSPSQAARLRAWNGLDWALYAHLNRSFWRRAEAFGATRLRDEVARLRRRRAALARRCLRGGGPSPARAIADGRLRPFQPPGRTQILGYALRAGLPPAERERCARLATPELQYKDILDRRQFGGGNGSVPPGG